MICLLLEEPSCAQRPTVAPAAAGEITPHRFDNAPILHYIAQVDIDIIWFSINQQAGFVV